jgi:hypothetical protein
MIKLIIVLQFNIIDISKSLKKTHSITDTQNNNEYFDANYLFK